MVFLDNEKYNEFLQHTFEMFDFEGSHTIDLEVFKMLFASLNKQIQPNVLNNLEKKIEKEGRDGVKYEEFADRYTKSFPLGHVHEDLEYAFSNSCDEDGNITYKSLKKANDDAKLGFTDEEIRSIIKEFDVDKDGKISFAEIEKRFLSDDIEFKLEVPDNLQPIITIPEPESIP